MKLTVKSMHTVCPEVTPIPQFFRQSLQPERGYRGRIALHEQENLLGWISSQKKQQALKARSIKGLNFQWLIQVLIILKRMTEPLYDIGCQRPFRYKSVVIHPRYSVCTRRNPKYYTKFFGYCILHVHVYIFPLIIICNWLWLHNILYRTWTLELSSCSTSPPRPQHHDGYKNTLM